MTAAVKQYISAAGMVVALIAEKEVMFPPVASPKDSTPFEARVVRKREIPTITSAIPDQKEWYCSYVKPNCSDPGEQCSLEDTHNRKENTLRSLSKDIDSNFREVKQRFRYYRSNKEQKSNDSFEDDGSGGVNDDLNLEYTESQGSTFDRILKYDEHSRHHEKLIEKTTKTITNLQATYDYL